MQIGFVVYQYAKLKMLQFYFDFLDKYLDRSDFQYCEMDTDSAYIAIADQNGNLYLVLNCFVWSVEH